MGLYHSPRIITNGLILALDAANFKSSISGSSSWNDLSNNGNNATLISGSVFNSANCGNIVFNGSSSYASIANNSTFSVQNFTINAWVKFNGFNAYNTIITKPQNGPVWSNPYLSWLLRINNGTTLEFGIGDSSTYNSSAYAYTFSTGKFYNLVCTFDGQNQISYINNSSVKTINYLVPITINYTTVPVFIGAGYGASPIGEFLNGNIYSIAMYNRALTSTEVSQNYNATKVRFGL